MLFCLKISLVKIFQPDAESWYFLSFCVCQKILPQSFQVISINTAFFKNFHNVVFSRPLKFRGNYREKCATIVFYNHRVISIKSRRANMLFIKLKV